MANLSISVAMCTYNGERFLQEQLQSILNQTRLPDELVICDDGSSDTTHKIIERFSVSSPFQVKYVRNSRNLGPTKNFDQAIGLCRSDLIALSDQDDIWQPDKLAVQARALEQDLLAGGIFSDAILIDDLSRELGMKLWASIPFTSREQKIANLKQLVPVLLRKNVVTGATLMFRSKLRRLILPIPQSWFHDAWIACLLAVTSHLLLAEMPLIRYRIHVNQQASVGRFGPSARMSIWVRFIHARREEPARRLATVQEMEELRQRLQQAGDADNLAMSAVENKIKFAWGRARSPRGRFFTMLWVLLNVRKYHRCENGWRPWLRDLVLAIWK